ncbi:MAG: hypothetical protein GVY09_03840 [Gammaproteobacteria bacterium]|jgi:hypothetical protein|nr:hypothetical protein [Gammaproteobacteria bacterium]
MIINARLLLALALPAALFAQGVPAQTACGSPRLTQTELGTALEGNTLTFDCQLNCDGWMASTSTDWHERHDGNGTTGSALVEIGTGSGGVQPTEQVGTWQIDTTDDPGTVTYSYDGVTEDYTYTVELVSGNLGQSGSTYNFCNSGDNIKAEATID